jgi:hypothetical protein
MKSPSALAVIAIPALMSLFASAQSSQDPFDGYPYRPYQGTSPYGDWTPNESDASVYSDSYSLPEGAGARNPYPSDGTRRPGGSYAPPGWGQGAPYVSPRKGPMDSYEPNPTGRWSDLPPTYPLMPPAAARELPPPPQPEYRFRGDKWSPPGAVPWQDGYHFRPLTEVERDRTGYEGGWRPLGPGSTGERAIEDPFSPAEAFGYESDDWFRRFYRN